MRAVYELEEHAQMEQHKKLVMRTAGAAHAQKHFQGTTHVLHRHFGDNNNRALKVVPATRHGLKTALTYLTHISSVEVWSRFEICFKKSRSGMQMCFQSILEHMTKNGKNWNDYSSDVWGSLTQMSAAIVRIYYSLLSAPIVHYSSNSRTLCHKILMFSIKLEQHVPEHWEQLQCR